MALFCFFLEYKVVEQFVFLMASDMPAHNNTVTQKLLYPALLHGAYCPSYRNAVVCTLLLRGRLLSMHCYHSRRNLQKSPTTQKRYQYANISRTLYLIFQSFLKENIFLNRKSNKKREKPHRFKIHAIKIQRSPWQDCFIKILLYYFFIALYNL